MPQLSLGSRIAKDTTTVIDRVLDGDTLLIHLKSGDLFSLNPVGTCIWEHIDGTRTIEDLADAVASEYEVSASDAQKDALDLVQNLFDEGLVVLVQ